MVWVVYLVNLKIKNLLLNGFVCCLFVIRRDKHRDKDRDREHKDKNHKEHHSSSSKEHKSSHRDKDKHHSSSKSSSSHDRHKERESKKSLENGVADQQKQQLHQQQQEQPQIKVNEPDVVEVKEELRDPLDTSNYSFSESNAIQANGIRECFVNVSQISNSSCDYSMSQFRPDESAFSIKGTTGGIRFDDDSRDIGDYDQGDNGNGDDAGDEDYNDNNGDDSDEDMPIAKRKKIKREISDDDDDEDLPLTARKKPKTEVKKPKKIKREPSDDDEDEDDYDKPKKKKIKKEKVRRFHRFIGGLRGFILLINVQVSGIFLTTLPVFVYLKFRK